MAVILWFLADGMEVREVAGEYGLELDEVLAALGYAAKITAGEEICDYA